MTDTARLSLPLLAAQQSQPEIAWNEALTKLDPLVQPTVINRTTTTPPGTPAEGDCYIVAATATGIWAGHETDIAHYAGAAWSFYTPAEGWAAYDQGANQLVIFDGTAWASPFGTGNGTVTSVDLAVPAEFIVLGNPVTAAGTLMIFKTDQAANTVWSGPGSGAAAAPAFRALVAADIPDLSALYAPLVQPYDVGGFYPGVPGASAVVCLHVFNRSVTFPAGLTGSHGVALTAATAQTDFDLQKNGASVGTLRFAAAGTTASFIMASQTVYAAGDVLKAIAPATPDATLADLSFTLAGTRG